MKKHSFKDVAASYLLDIRKMVLFIKEDIDNKKEKKAVKEPATWKFGKTDGGKWEFEWDAAGGQGKATGDFAYALKCMKAFEFVLDGTQVKDLMEKMATETQQAVDAELGKG